MVPDKIYIRTGMSGLLYGSKGKSFETDAEYICKDALLKWLEHAKTVYNIRGANAFELLTLQMIIEHINEM